MPKFPPRDVISFSNRSDLIQELKEIKINNNSKSSIGNSKARFYIGENNSRFVLPFYPNEKYSISFNRNSFHPSGVLLSTLCSIKFPRNEWKCGGWFSGRNSFSIKNSSLLL